jgi:hypothetical protein
LDRAEHIIEQVSAIPRRRKMVLAGGLIAILVILGIGLNTIFAQVLGGHSAAKKGAPKDKPVQQGSAVATGNDSDPTEPIQKATFEYLLPGYSSGWKMDDDSKAYVPSKSIVKFNLLLGATATTITEQMLPPALAPRQSAAFQSFVMGSKVSRSQDVGSGTLYFLPALQNGAPANGADTIIYATDEVLMFGRSGSVVGYDKWVKLFESMKKR